MMGGDTLCHGLARTLDAQDGLGDDGEHSYGICNADAREQARSVCS